MTRKEIKTFADERSAADFTIATELQIWGTNSALEEKRVTLEVTFFNLADAAWKESWSKEVVLSANSSTELYKGEVVGQPVRTKLSDLPKDIIISARLLDGDVILGRYSNW